MPENVFRYSGIATPIEISRILGSSPMPNQTMNTGISPNSGSVRSICMQRVDRVLAQPAEPGA